jgi:hypothetical protein
MKDKNLSRRLDRLEERLGVKPQPYPHVMTTNINFYHPDECPPELVLVPDVYLVVFGRNLTPAELEALRADYKRKHGIDDEISQPD